MRKRSIALTTLVLLFLLVLTAAACRKNVVTEEEEDTSIPEFIATVPPEEYDFGVDPAE